MKNQQIESIAATGELFKMGDKLKVLELAIRLFDGECDRLWKRFSAILTANVVFVAVLKLSGESQHPAVFILSGLFGMALCFCWYRIIKLSRHYEVRWQKDIVVIIESDENLKDFLRGFSRERVREKRPYSESSSSYAQLIIILIAIVWTGILFYGLTLL